MIKIEFYVKVNGTRSERIPFELEIKKLELEEIRGKLKAEFNCGIDFIYKEL